MRRGGRVGEEKVVSEDEPKCSLCTLDTLFSEESLCG